MWLLSQNYAELQQTLQEAEKRESELRVDLHDLVEIQGNQGQLLSETTGQLDEAKDKIEEQQRELNERAEEIEKLQTKVI